MRDNIVGELSELRKAKKLIINSDSQEGLDGGNGNIPTTLVIEEIEEAIQQILTPIYLEFDEKFREIISQPRDQINNKLKEFINNIQPLLDSGAIEELFLTGKDTLGEDIRIYILKKLMYLDTSKHPNGIVFCQGVNNLDFLADYTLFSTRKTPILNPENRI